MEQAKILQELEQKGYPCRLVAYEHVAEIQQTLASLVAEKSLAPEVDEVVRLYVDFAPPEEMPSPRSVLILSIPDPANQRTSFRHQGREYPVTVPSAYLPAARNREEVTRDVSEILARFGFSCTRAPLPHKTLAVRSGLARYGRNNITYVEGLGTFHRLMAFYSDLPCDQDPWQEPRLLERCADCQACLKRCPGEAISAERVLIHAEHCVTLYNEKDLEVTFPDWMQPDMHSCLAGCLECQKVCPENHDALQFVDGEGYDESETALFLQGVTEQDLPAATRAKLERNGLLGLLEVLPRNLAVLLQ